MTAAGDKRRFAARPGEAERWVKAPDAPRARQAGAEDFTARLTIDVTRAQRGRIKVAAFRRGVTVADMLRDLFAREFPDTDGGAS